MGGMRSTPVPPAGERTITDAWLVVPLFQEAAVIGDVVAEARAVFPNVVCVDDGSTDGSGERAAEAGAVVVRHPVNLGQGAALQTGIEWVLTRTDAPYLVTFDADGQHQARDAEAMVATARERDLAFVLGSRFLGAAPQGMGAARRAVVRAAALATSPDAPISHRRHREREAVSPGVAGNRCSRSIRRTSVPTR